MKYGTWNNEVYNTKHGGPYDRGAADSYYARPRDPHYWPAGTHKGYRIDERAMTRFDIESYNAGYDWNEMHGDKKDWG